jgi:hypothetical protein
VVDAKLEVQNWGLANLSAVLTDKNISMSLQQISCEDMMILYLHLQRTVPVKEAFKVSYAFSLTY